MIGLGTNWICENSNLIIIIFGYLETNNNIWIIYETYVTYQTSLLLDKLFIIHLLILIFCNTVYITIGFMVKLTLWNFLTANQWR